MFVPTPFSAWWWFARLEKRLEQRRPKIELYERYHHGEHDTAFAAQFRKHFGGAIAPPVDSWCELVVDAAVERMRIEGFRFGGQKAVAEAWTIRQANALDRGSITAHTTAQVCGEAYVMVAPDPGPQLGRVGRGQANTPLITIEHPSEVIVECAAGQPLHRLAALKKWRGMDGKLYANVYLPGRVDPGGLPLAAAVYKFVSHGGQSQVALPAGVDLLTLNGWRELAIEPNPLGVVPIIPIIRKPDARGVGRSVLATIIPLQDLVTKVLTDATVTSEFMAFAQRWATGLQTHDDDGEPIDLSSLLAAAARVWTVEETEAKFGAFPTADLKNYLSLIELVVHHIAAHTRTPLHYLPGGEIANVAEGALKALEVGLVARVARDKIDSGEGWEEVARTAFLARGQNRKAQMLGAETIWGDSENRSEGERVDALTKLRSIDVPRRAVWERVPGVTQAEVDRWEKLAEDEARRERDRKPDVLPPPPGDGDPPEPSPT